MAGPIKTMSSSVDSDIWTLWTKTHGMELNGRAGAQNVPSSKGTVGKRGRVI